MLRIQSPHETAEISMKELYMFQDMPTVMDVSAELAVMRALRAMPEDYLIAHRDEFVDVVNKLDDSHADSSGGRVRVNT